MESIVLISDFVGLYQIATNNITDETVMQADIDNLTGKYLRKLLGSELFDLFITGIETDPIDEIWSKIKDPLHFDYCGKLYESDGIKKMLLGFIYFDRVDDNSQYQTPISTVIPTTENGEVVGINANSLKRYNWAVESAKTIQQYIRNNSRDYPKYNGQHFRFEYFL